MKKSAKYYLAGTLIIPGLLGSLVYGANYVSSDEEKNSTALQEDKKKGNKTSIKTLNLDAASATANGTTVPVPVWSAPTYKAATTFTEDSAVTALSSEVTTNEDGYSGITPAIGLSTFTDTYQELEADGDILHIHTKAKGNGTAALQAYRQEITLDSDIADEFFSTANYKQYITGTVSRDKDAVWPLNGTKTMDIADLWGNSSWLGSTDTMNYDSTTKSIYYKSAQYTVQIGSGVTIETDMYIDLGKWSKETGKLVERKDNYTITTKTDANSAAIGFTNKIVGSVASADILDSWIENPVEDTTLYYLTENESYFYGNGLQDEVNEHATDYDIELMVNGTPFKYVKMADEDGGTNSRGETIKKGDWDFDFGSYLNEGDVVTARVRGKETYENINGVKPTKYSSISHASDATKIVGWEDWEIAAPSVPSIYEEDLIIPVHAPVQNQQLNRSYKLIVTVNDQEVYNKTVKDETDVNVPYLSGLADGDIIKSKIVGSQAGEADKASEEITTVVTTQDNEGYDEWEVQPAVINGPVYEGATVISGIVPIQNRAAGRTYDLKVYIGEELVIDEQDIDVALKGYDFSYSLTDLRDLREGVLNYGEKIRAVVTGHQPDSETSGAKYEDKVAESEQTVNDNTGYSNWTVEKPVIDATKDTDTVISGNIGEQNTESGRSYKVAIWKDDEEPVYVTPAEDGTFKLEDVVLYEGEEINAKVIGSQESREDKESKATTTTVKDGTNYAEWEVNAPTVNELSDEDTTITGTIGEQDEDFSRTYDVEVFVNGNSKGKAEVLEDGTFKADKIVLVEGDKVTAKLTGHQDGKEDKTAVSEVVVVSDSSNYVDWTVSKPNVSELSDGKVSITGNIGEQDKTSGRTYTVEVFVNNESFGEATVAADGSFTTTEVDLKEGDKVKAVVTGHQVGKDDKTATSEEVVVSDSSNYAGWEVSPVTLDEIYEGTDIVTGEIKEDTSNGRTYEVIVKVDGEEKAKKVVDPASGRYNIYLEGVSLTAGQSVSVEVVGHQEGKDDKHSTSVTQTVKERVYNTNSNFKNGYWQNYGLVYEGMIDNQGWDLSDASRITKTAQLINQTTGEVVSDGITVANTNWYDATRYNGYQIIVNNDVLGGLSEGTYTIQLTVAIDGEEKATVDLTLTQVSRMGPMHDNYADMEQVAIKQNIVKPQVIDNKPGIVITRDNEASVQIFNKYWNDSSELVFEGYVNTTADLTNAKKQLVIKDASGQVVETRNNIYTFSSSWGISVDVDPIKSFQAIVPAEYTNQANYTYELVATDSEGTTLLTEALN